MTSLKTNRFYFRFKTQSVRSYTDFVTRPLPLPFSLHVHIWMSEPSMTCAAAVPTPLHSPSLLTEKKQQKNAFCLEDLLSENVTCPRWHGTLLSPWHRENCYCYIPCKCGSGEHQPSCTHALSPTLFSFGAKIKAGASYQRAGIKPKVFVALRRHTAAPSLHLLLEPCAFKLQHQIRVIIYPWGGDACSPASPPSLYLSQLHAGWFPVQGRRRRRVKGRWGVVGCRLEEQAGSTQKLVSFPLHPCS